jgi:hypothetical protein
VEAAINTAYAVLPQIENLISVAGDVETNVDVGPLAFWQSSASSSASCQTKMKAALLRLERGGVVVVTSFHICNKGDGGDPPRLQGCI